MDKNRPLRGNAAPTLIEINYLSNKIWNGEFARCAVCFNWHQEATIGAIAVAELRVVGTGQLVDNASYVVCDNCLASFLKSPEKQRKVWAYLMPEVPLKKEGRS